MIKKAIVLLEGRLRNLKELPLHVFYLFEEPDLHSEEALGMVKALDAQDRGAFRLIHFLPSPFSSDPDIKSLS
jgi:glutamyl-tRNA synthetase